MSANDEKQEQKNSEEQKPAQDQEQQALKLCQRELQEWKDKAFRITADFENFKKRLEKDQAVWQRMIQADIFLKLLEIVDNFDRALEQEKGTEAQLAGFALIRKDLQKLLETFDVKEITDFKQFDPLIHESVMTVSSPAHKPGDIVAVLQKGYTFKDQVLRPAKVSIAQ